MEREDWGYEMDNWEQSVSRNENLLSSRKCGFSILNRTTMDRGSSQSYRPNPILPTPAPPAIGDLH